MISHCVANAHQTFLLSEAYANCCENVLQFINERNELRVVDIDPACAISLGCNFQRAQDAHE